MSAEKPPKKTPRKEYPAETRAACMAALLTGQGIGEIAAQYKVPEGTLKSWRARMKPGEGTQVAAVASQKRDEIGGLLIEYLYENLQTLKAQAVVFRDPDWLKKQSADELAVLHGVMTDKSIRLLEALGNAGHPVA